MEVVSERGYTPGGSCREGGPVRPGLKLTELVPSVTGLARKA